MCVVCVVQREGLIGCGEVVVDADAAAAAAVT
ncbi:MAG: hypothetical protein ACI90V_005058, partial [Bacillariaceae sp.]